LRPALLSLLLLGPPGQTQQTADTCQAGAEDLGLPALAPVLVVEPQVATRVRARDLAGQDELHATCYDDGDSCPGGCDEHVVANNATNGSARFHAPGSGAGDWRSCRDGLGCEVCFGDDPEGCITLTYRGTGPDAGRADFTAAFWAGICQRGDLPDTLDDECTRIDNAAADLRAVSCLQRPDAPSCVGVVPTAAELAAARQAVQDCLSRRNNSWRCYYRGPNGTLSAGTCGNGAVNSSGWDCCSGDRAHDACVTGCSQYYVNER